MSRHGENIRKRTDGRWEGRYAVYLPEKGRQLMSVYGKTYSEVKQKKAEALNAVRTQNADSFIPKNKDSGTDILLESAIREWLAKIEKTKKPATYIKYRSIYETYLEDIVTDIPLHKTAADDFQNMLIAKTADCSESIKKSIYSVVSGALNYSAENYHTLPVRLKRSNTVHAGEKLNIYTQAEQESLLRYLYIDMDLSKMGILLCLSTGLRLGELCALKWEDIDFQNKILHVNHTVQRISVHDQEAKTALCEGTPKTSCSRREVPLSDEMLLLLSKFKHHGTYIFHHASPLEPRTYQYQFKKYQQQAGIACRNFHVLRHTFATNCMENGVDIKSLSEILGHSNVQITLNKYVHPTLDTKRQHMNNISSVYGRIVGYTI